MTDRVLSAEEYAPEEDAHDSAVAQSGVHICPIALYFLSTAIHHMTESNPQ